MLAMARVEHAGQPTCAAAAEEEEVEAEAEVADGGIG